MNCFFLLALCRLVVATVAHSPEVAPHATEAESGRPAEHFVQFALGVDSEIKESSTQSTAPATGPTPPFGSGRIEGKVVYRPTGKPLPGVTVTASGPALAQEQTEFTDSNGEYTITDLPTGEYTLSFYFSTSKVERPNVVIANATAVVVNGVFEHLNVPTPNYSSRYGNSWNGCPEGFHVACADNNSTNCSLCKEDDFFSRFAAGFYFRRAPSWVGPAVFGAGLILIATVIMLTLPPPTRYY